MSRLPKDWVETTTEIVFTQMSISNLKVKTSDCAEIGTYPVVDQGQKLISGYIDSLESLVKIEGPVVIFGDHTRIIKWIDFDFIPGADGTKVLKSSKYIQSRFFYYHLRAIELPNKGYARHFKELKESIFHIVSLAEQHEITRRLDSLLGQVDRIKSRLDGVPAILKKFRQSVLAAAVSGKLTEGWRAENIPDDINVFKKNIREYRYVKWLKEQEQKHMDKGKIPKTENWKEKYNEITLPEDFKNEDLPTGWLNEPLEGLVYISARIGWKGLTAAEYTNEGPLFLSVHSLNYGKVVKLSEAFHITEDRYFESPEIILQNNDILLCKDGAGIGKIGIVKNLESPATINSSLLLVRADDFFIPEYLFFLLSGPKMQQLVHERVTGTAIPHLFQRDIKEFILPVPPLIEQKEIVRRVESLFALADTIDARLASARSSVGKLTQSILAKAFSGEITKEWRELNAELISGENSAQKLLSKIKEEHKKIGEKKKNSGTKK